MIESTPTRGYQFSTAGRRQALHHKIVVLHGGLTNMHVNRRRGVIAWNLITFPDVTKDKLRGTNAYPEVIIFS